MNEFKQLASFIGQTNNLSEQDLGYIASKITETELSMGEFLRKSGSSTCRIGYLYSGVLGIFMQMNDGNLALRHLVTERHFFTDLVDINNGNCTRYSIQALTPCRLSSISLIEARQLADEFPALRPYYHQIREQSLLDVIHNLDFLRQGSHTEQYLRLMDEHPALFQQLPLKYIAEFLGITPQSLSRIRHSV